MRTTYITVLLAWVLPPIAFQWAMGGRILAARWRVLAVAIPLSTLWLVAADHLAIREGIWLFNPDKLLGPRIGQVPVEEALFFLCTNVLVAQSMVLFGPAMHALQRSTARRR